MARNKGARGEREVIKILQPIHNEEYSAAELPIVDIERNLQQYIAGGNDIRGLHGISLEVKFCETFNLKAWWNQTVTQAERVKGIPVLIYRRSRIAWRVRMYGNIGDNMVNVKTIVDIDIDSFLIYYRHRVRAMLELQKQSVV